MSIIPFVLSDVVDSTYPVKLFEYMALGHPIITTDMSECRKYKSVLIGKTASDFVKKIDEALTMKNDEEYKNISAKEANENSWEKKQK